VALPRELTDEEAQEIVQDFRLAAKRAVKDAGFDGVEVHGANGYLIDQFLCETTNKRDYGRYAGTSLETRSQFLRDVLTAVVDEVGADRVGLRISPNNSYQDMHRVTEEKALEEVKYVAQMASDFDIAYLHVMRADFFGVQKADIVPVARGFFKNTLIVNMGYQAEEAEDGVTNNLFDAVAFGTNILANPDCKLCYKCRFHPLIASSRTLVSLLQIRRGSAPNADLFYTKEAAGYTDYPFMSKN
jgi:N-ethylmaleimide reductase